MLAAAAAVLVLAGVLLRTGRFRPPEYVGVALLLLGSVPLLWAGYRQLQPLDEAGDLPVQEERGSLQGVALNDVRARVVQELGPASSEDPSSIAPLGEDFDAIGGPPFIATPGSSHETLRYPSASVLLSDGRAYGIVVTDDGAETAEGVGVGDNLALAEERYPTLDCGLARLGEYRTFPYCGGRVGPRRWLWFGQDPIRSIVLTSTELGPD